MPRSLAIALTATDLVFLAYWSVAAAAACGLITLPAALMYADYNNPLVVAWNWSFFPLDVAFSCLGLSAVAASRRGSALWRPLALMSLTMTMIAGLMAVAFWTLLKQFDPAWFLANLLLLVWPLFFLRGLIIGSAGR